MLQHGSWFMVCVRGDARDVREEFGGGWACPMDGRTCPDKDDLSMCSKCTL